MEADKLRAEIKKIWTDSKARYGALKIQKILTSQGKSISLKRVQRYITDLGIRSIVIKKF
ncbi:IS3 family transposase [Anaerocolumna chitinilytica]|uniref:IS3 family transposase n=1 Tax=Anaerocolumna chitinilytica TaxID=1727145 RepID=UPI001624518D